MEDELCGEGKKGKKENTGSFVLYSGQEREKGWKSGLVMAGMH